MLYLTYVNLWAKIKGTKTKPITQTMLTKQTLKTPKMKPKRNRPIMPKTMSRPKPTTIRYRLLSPQPRTLRPRKSKLKAYRWFHKLKLSPLEIVCLPNRPRKIRRHRLLSKVQTSQLLFNRYLLLKKQKITSTYRYRKLQRKYKTKFYRI